MITPKEIEMKEFTRTKVGGYKPEEVDEFLDRIMADYESLLEEREMLNKRISYLNEKLDKVREDQDKMRSSVVNNQKSYDDMMGSARRKADKLVADAQDYAKRLIETAKEEADRQQQVKTQLTAEVESFKAKLLGIYENHVKLISTIPVFKRDDEEYSSETLEMLKVATADVTFSEPAYEEEAVSVSEPEEEIEDDFSVEEDATLVMPTIRTEKESVADSSRSRRVNKKYDDDFDDIDDDEDIEDIDDTSENDNQIKGLFSSEKKRKPLFGSGKKKSRLFSRDDDDDDDDDDDEDDDD